MPQRGEDLPRRTPLGESQPEQSSGSFFECAQPSPAQSNGLPRREPAEGATQAGSGTPVPGPATSSTGSFFERAESAKATEPGLPQRRPDYDMQQARANEASDSGDALPKRGAASDLPQRSAASDLPQRGADNGLPQRSAAHDLPQRSAASDLPQRGADNGLPQRGADNGLPQRSADNGLPQRGDANGLPQRGDGLSGLPQRGGAGDLPQRNGNQPDGLGALPRRTTRTRPRGRHRSPHRLSVASDAPALVIAVPGSAEADVAEIGPHVASIAGLSCPGVDIRVGYLDGDDMSLAECLAPVGSGDGDDQFPNVVVPLLLSPNAQIDPVLRQYVAQQAVPAVFAGHLGPHPMVAEALHSRLAEAGLARQARSTGLSIAADSRGVVVLADVGPEAASAAGVAAVLLASRLSVPVVPASLGDPSSIVDAVNRLSDSGAQRPVLAPCLIGPETNISVLEDLSNALNAPCAPTLGAHQTIGQLVAIRYGAALAGLSLAG